MRRLEPHSRWLLVAALAGLLAAPADARRARLRVCADPNNLPFSSRDGSGFENRLAELLAKDLGAQLQYTWWPERRGALRNTLKSGSCDVVMGVPTSLTAVATTRPYYASSYVFLSRKARGLDVSSFDDPRLTRLRVGVELVGDDYANTPPVHALSARGISDNVRGFSVLGDYGQALPTAGVVRAVERDEVDVALVWGPLAGYFARDASRGLCLIPTPARDGTLPMRFEMSMAVRRGDSALRAELDAFIERRRRDIDRLLQSYGVPRP